MSISQIFNPCQRNPNPVFAVVARSREEIETIELPVVGDVIADRIYLRPDWPPIGSPDFAAKLRAWHAAHNGAAHNGEKEI